MKEMDLTEGKIGKALLQFSIPFLLASILQAFYGAVDLFVVGQFSTSSGVSAVATGSQVMQTLTGVILGISTGTTILIGQYLGAKKQQQIAQTIGTAICIFTLFAVCLTIVMTLLTPTLAKVMHTPIEAMEETKQYIFICSLGIPFIIGYNAASGIFRGLGDSKTPLILVAIACAINVIGDLILVAVFHMGAAGAAIATSASQGTSFLLAVIYLKKKGFSFPFHKKDIRLDTKKAKQIFRLGLPIALQDGLINISFLMITAIINLMGLTASATVGVVEKIIVFAMLPAQAFASAVAVMTAQNMGANKPQRAQKGLYTGISMALVFGVSFFVYAQIDSSKLIGLFTKDSDVIELSQLYLKSYSWDCVLICFLFLLNSFFSGCGRSIFPMIHSFIATFLVRIPGSYFLSKMQGATLYEIGFAAPVATILSLIICFVYFKRGTWKKMSVAS
mgnify:FL=1